MAGEAAAATYSWVTSGSASDQGARNAGARYADAQRENIERTLIDSKSDVGGRGLGKWIALLPTKLGGGTYALDLNTNRVLSSIWYWTYGDFNPISHHLCAFPSADPYHSFEFIDRHARRQELPDLRHQHQDPHTNSPVDLSCDSVDDSPERCETIAEDEKTARRIPEQRRRCHCQQTYRST